MRSRYSEWIDALERAALERPGTLPASQRRAIADRTELPAPLRAYLEKVHQHAYKVTDEDVEALKRAGFSEDQIFEATVAAAVGAGLRRIRAGLGAIEREK